MIINGRDKARLDGAAEALRSSAPGGRVVPLAADVSEYGEVERLFAEAERLTGGVDALINNAGVSHFGLFQDMKPEEWEDLTAVNLFGVFNCVRAALPCMLKKGKGCVINVSSVWGGRGASCEAVYAASKDGVNAFTRSLAKELGPAGIRVNAISCGFIETGMNARLTEDERRAFLENVPLGRAGRPEEVAELALFLASGKADYINGQILTIDGGMW